MQIKPTNLILLVILSLGAGVAGTWFFATMETVSRPVRDVIDMAVLFAGLITAGYFLVILLAKTGSGKTPSE